MAYLAIIATCSNQEEYEKLNFSGFVVKVAESHFAWFLTAAVYCNCYGHQKKRNDSFQ